MWYRIENLNKITGIFNAFPLDYTKLNIPNDDYSIIYIDALLGEIC